LIEEDLGGYVSKARSTTADLTWYEERVRSASPDPNVFVEARANFAGMLTETIPDLLDPVPRNQREARRSRDAARWEGAEVKHMGVLEKLGVLKLVPLPKGKKTIKCGIVYKARRDKLGRLLELCARVVGRGYSQIEGEDYFESYAPVVRYATLRVFFALACTLDMDLYHFDVNSAYLHAPLKEEIYMEQLPGHEIQSEPGSPRLVYRVLRALPGLKQAAAAWHEKLKSTLFALGYSNTNMDHSFFQNRPKIEIESEIDSKIDVDPSCVFTRGKDVVLLADWVDDGGVGCTKGTNIEEFFRALEKSFPIKVSEMEFFLGMRVTRDRKLKRLTLTQTQLIDGLSQFASADRRVTTPMLPGLVLPQTSHQVSSEAEGEQTGLLKGKYRQILGSLLYLANLTRPDIAYCTSYLSRFASGPTRVHMDALLRVVQYVLGTRTMGVSYDGTVDNPLTLHGFVDATWVGRLGTDPLSRSTTGFVFFLGGGPISWKSAVQKRPALSSTDAEIIAASEGARDAVWLRQLLGELGFQQHGPTVLFEDNRGCEETVKNGALRDRLKHVLLREHFVLWASRDGWVKLVHVATQDQVADVLTKALPATLHHALVKRLCQPQLV
jgi:hypothetical protein